MALEEDNSSRKRSNFQKLGFSIPRISKSYDFAERQMVSPSFSTKYDETSVLQKKLGVSMEEKERNNALRKLGVTNEDVKIAEYLMKEVPISEGLRKEEKIFGYSKGQLEREKALQTLGTTEEEIIESRAKKLGKLGTAIRSVSPSRTSLNDLVASFRSNSDDKLSYVELEYELFKAKKKT